MAYTNHSNSKERSSFREWLVAPTTIAGAITGGSIGAFTGNPIGTALGMAAGAVVASAIESYAGESSRGQTEPKAPAQ